MTEPGFWVDDVDVDGTMTASYTVTVNGTVQPGGA